MGHAAQAELCGKLLQLGGHLHGKCGAGLLVLWQVSGGDVQHGIGAKAWVGREAYDWTHVRRSKVED